MQIILQTRFSYFGNSAWQSDASKDPKLLFAPARLESRFFYFENITLPSLASQSDDDFHLHILSSDLMPAHYKERLISVSQRALGRERVKVYFEDNRHAGRYFRKFAVSQFGHDTVAAQTVLDDDDALADNFVASLRASMTLQSAQLTRAQDYTALSFPLGYYMVLNLDPEHWFSLVNVPFINLGLAWFGPVGLPKNAFMTKHLQIPLNHPSRSINTGAPMYIRTIHNTNDSRAYVPEKHAANAVSPEKVAQQFTWLTPEHRNRILSTQRDLFPERGVNYLVQNANPPST